MSLDVDEEILQDFLVEAGEILELLSEQLVDLEHRPGDTELLNAIFRGFHTVKGGAGFMQLHALVSCCHSAENVFDKLRNQDIQVSTVLMDVVLQALDTINEQFADVRAGEPPVDAAPELLAALDALTRGEHFADAAAVTAAVASPEASVDAPAAIDADAEFEKMLDAISDSDSPAPVATSSDEITDDEFEALLDELHGKGKHGGVVETAAGAAVVAPAAADDVDPVISDAEFEALLDELHGKGQHGGVVEAAAGAAVVAPAAAAPVAAAGDDGMITEDEFEALLDELQAQGKGAFSAPSSPDSTVAPPTAVAPGPSPGPAPSPSLRPSLSPVSTPPPVVPALKAERPVVAETTVRVDTQRLDEIMNMVGELVLVRNRLVRLGATIPDEEVGKAVASLDMVTADLQTSVMKTRMQPIKKVFGRFPRVVRDLARTLNKEIRLELFGEETDLDKNLVEALADPLVHLVRNAVDHGIETPDVREAAGKPREGVVKLSAEQEGDHILLSISDDGAGMDADRLRGIAVEKGMMDQDAAERLSDNEAFNLIFSAGFSTKKEISDVSGRGVGMDVVKTKITQLNGTLGIDSVPGQGSRIEIKVPLTLAIMPTLMVMLNNQAFALPLVSVNEIFHLNLTQTNVVDGQEVVVVREKVLPLFHLKRWLVGSCLGEALPDTGHVVIVTVGTQRVGFIVDQLVGQEEVVIKPLGKMLLGTPGMSGATITGDGRIALILDIPSLLKHYSPH
ncbi:MAG: two-component system chemotaxis sensor kinase CheA [Motiliproteus sp.]|jgi:two-component system chemotaxis sensor kinase CheA